MSTQEPWQEGRVLTAEEVAHRETRKQAAIQVAQETPGTTTRHFRLSIDFHLTIAGTPPDDDGLNEPDPLYHTRQARLLAAVKGNQAVLHRWIEGLIVGQMQQKSWSDWDALTGGDVAFQELLAPALQILSQDDQAFFLAELPQGIFFDDLIDLFSASFSVTEDVPVIEEVS